MKFFFATILLLLLLTGCIDKKAINEEVFESKLNSVLINGEQTNIDLKDITDFSWDKVFIFSPYTSSEEISEKIGVKWTYSKKIEVLDSIQLIVFLKDNEVVKYIEVSRSSDVFSEIHDSGVSVGDAKIRVEKKED